MNPEKPDHRKDQITGPKMPNSGPAGPNMNRRRILAGGGAALGAAAVGAGMVYVGKKQMEHYDQQVAEREERERPFTHKGKALVINKIEKKGSGRPTETEIASSALSGYALDGLRGALMHIGAAAGTSSMDTSQYYLVLKADDRSVVMENVTPLMYKITNQGDELPIEYVIDENDPQKIVRIKKLEPVR